MTRFILAIFFLLNSHFSSAQVLQPTFGSEFEFTHSSLHVGGISQGLRGTEKYAAKKMAQIIEKKCLVIGCDVEKVNYKWGSEYKVKFQDGKYFIVSYDPLTIEVIVNPMTLDEWQNRKDLLNYIIFDSALEAGYAPDESRAGHHNMGVLSVFGENTELFLKFFVDYVNHAELASGVLRENWKTAAPLFALGEKPSLELQKIVDEFYKGEHEKISDLVFQINQRVYAKGLVPEWWKEVNSINQAMSLKKITSSRLRLSDQPIETRAVRAQKNVEEFILVSKLFLARIEFLKRNKDRISVNYFDPRSFSEKQKLDLFSDYVEESQLNIVDFFKLVPGLYLHTLKSRLQSNERMARLYPVRSCSSLF